MEEEGKAKPRKIDEEIVELQQQAEANLNMAKMIKAEFENYKKRNAESVLAAFDDGKVFAIKVILPLLDALHEAKATMKEAADVEGLDILIRKFNSGLESLNLVEIPTDGKFDPYVHNAVATQQVEDVEPDTILAVWQKGYILGKKVIRPATVKVST